MSEITLPKAILFDWDGTLVDSYDLLLQAHNYARGKIGMAAFAHDEFRPYFGKPRDYIYPTIYGERQTEARQYFEEFVTKNHIEFLSPINGVKELLKVISDLNLISGVISNKKGKFIREEIKHYGWGPYFSTIIGAGEAPEDKPSGAPLLMAAAQLGLEADMADIWYIGDTEIDMQAAYHAGCKAILIQEKDVQGDLDDKYRPLMVAENCEDLQRFLLQCSKNQLKRNPNRV